MMHTTLCGTVYIHQGQEIGMVNLPKEWPLEEWKDCKTQNVAKKSVTHRLILSLDWQLTETGFLSEAAMFKDR